MLNIILRAQELLVDISSGVPKLPHAINTSHMHIDLHTIHSSETELIAVVQHNDQQLSGLNQVNHLTFMSIRQVLTHFDEAIISKIIYYKQFSHYLNTHKFCGNCGSPTTSQQQNKFLYCATCKHEVYPHIAPCIIVRILKDEQILMARGVGFAPGVWGLVAGFVEIGESLEEAVHREVKEEVGIAIKNLQYWGSQPWPFPGTSLMLGFTAEYASGEIVVQEAEIEEAGFFSYDNLPGMPSTSVSIASRMISEYKQKNT